MILKSDNYRIFRGDERVGLDGFYALLESNWTGECAEQKITSMLEVSKSFREIFQNYEKQQL